MELHFKSQPGASGKNLSFAGDQADLYEVLNISKFSSKSQIRESYIRLKNTFSSQSQALYSLISEEESSLMLKQIEEAFHVLNDDKTRREYDLKIGLYTLENSPADEKKSHVFTSEKIQTQNFDAFNGKSPRLNGPAFSPTTEFEPSTEASADTRTRFNAPPIIRNINAENVDIAEIRAKMQEAINVYAPNDGELYQKLREIAGVSETEIQERTKVSLQYIRAIEKNAFEQLPSPVFVKGFLRSYLKYLKVSQADEMVKAFGKRLEDWQQDSQGKIS